MNPVRQVRRNELFCDLVESLAAELEKINISDANQVAEETIMAIYENWRGLTITFPMRPEAYMDRLKKKISEEFNGQNITELVRKYKVSEHMIYRWNAEVRKARQQTNRETNYASS